MHFPKLAVSFYSGDMLFTFVKFLEKAKKKQNTKQSKNRN